MIGELTGGVGVYGRNLLGGLADLGLRPVVITPTPDHAPAGEVIPVRRFSGRGRWLPQALAFSQAVRRAGDRFDLIHFTDARFSLFLGSYPAPVVGTVNDYFYAVTSWFSGAGTSDIYQDWLLRHFYYNLTRALEGPCFRRLSHLICISNEVSSILGRRYSIPAEKRSVVPYGIAYGEARGATVSAPGPLILCAGGNFQRKGVGVLIRASRAILQEFPSARFVILGDSGDGALMKRLARELGVSAAFEFVGQVDYGTLYDYYCSASVYAMPSLLEAFGIPFLEAMHCGVPVVASDIPGPDDYLRHRQNALMAKTGDSEDLANCVLEILRDATLRDRLVEAGRETAKEFRVAEMARRTGEIYESAIAKSRSSTAR